MVLTCLGGALYQSLHFTVLAERQVAEGEVE
jgi:hypothetical protein